MLNDSKNIQAIDVHCHFGDCKGSGNELKNKFMSGDIRQIITYAEAANIKYSVGSPLSALMPEQGYDIAGGNRSSIQASIECKTFLFWCVVDPLNPDSYNQAEYVLQHPACAGMKIHPEAHSYRIAEYGDDIFKFAALHHTIIESHSGEGNCMPEDFIQFADAYPEVNLILSHLGCGVDEDLCHQIRAITKAKYSNIYTDTSSINSIIPNLLEFAIKEAGSSRILFGTDSPLHFAPMQRARIDYADIGYQDKKKILWDNAYDLFSPAIRRLENEKTHW